MSDKLSAMEAAQKKLRLNALINASRSVWVRKKPLRALIERAKGEKG